MYRQDRTALFCSSFILITSFAQLNAFKFGLEALSTATIQKYGLHTKRVGLVTNQTGVDHFGNRSVTVLRQKGVRITTIFVPEHGYNGIIAAGKSVDNSRDPVTKIPIVSLYSHEKGLVGKTINKEKLAAIDALIFDMQDSGMRHYTYISTLMRCLEACAEYNKLCIVLDRPNILGGQMEGPLVEPELISFISIAPIPLRHGLTIGEIAHFFNQHILKQKARLVIIPMQQYQRSMHGVPCFKKPLSPNLPTAQACLGYSFLGLLGEVSPFNVGVGTRHAFRAIMLPVSIQQPANLWPRVQHLLTKYGIGSIRQTIIDERTHKKVTGVLLQFNDISRIKTFSLFLDLLTLFMEAGIPLHCSSTFDKSVGIKSLRGAIEQKEPLDRFKELSTQSASHFFHTIRPFFLYKPHPHID